MCNFRCNNAKNEVTHDQNLLGGFPPSRYNLNYCSFSGVLHVYVAMTPFTFCDSEGVRSV